MMALFAKKKDELPKTDSAIAKQIEKQFRAGVNFKRNQGYYEKWSEYQRFWEANQWPAPTPKTRLMPRPVTNQFASIIEQLVSAVMYEMPEIYYEPGDGTPAEDAEDPNIENADVEAAELLTHVAEFNADRLELEQLLEEGCRTAASISGTAIWFFPWDNTITGGVDGKSKFIGDIAGYEIDPADFFPGDPTIRDIQSQPWIIVAERRPLDEVKEYYREFAPDAVDTLKPTPMTSDTQVYDHQSVEQDETGYVDIIHRWTKKRDGYEVRLDYHVACQGKLLRSEEGIYKHGLYPFVSFCWRPRRKSFWGKPEAADLIANQKMRNRLEGLNILSAQNTGAPRIRYKYSAVKPEEITNNPEQPIPDRSDGSGWGIDYMHPPAMSSDVPRTIERLDAGMKDASGVHEAFSGKAPSADLNASAIIALQEAAGVRLRGIQRRLHKALRDIGNLWLAHWKEFYTERRLIRITGENNEVAFRWFKGTDYKDMAFDARVKSGSASPYSRTLFMATLDNLLDRGVIQPDEYLELLPADIFPQIKQLLQKRAERAAEEQQPVLGQQPLQESPLMPQMSMEGFPFNALGDIPSADATQNVF